MKNAANVRELLIPAEWPTDNPRPSRGVKEEQRINDLFNVLCGASDEEAVSLVFDFAISTSREIGVRALQALRIGFPGGIGAFALRAKDFLDRAPEELALRLLVMQTLFEFGVPLDEDLGLATDAPADNKYDSVFVPVLKGIILEQLLSFSDRDDVRLFQKELIGAVFWYMQADRKLRCGRQGTIDTLLKQLYRESEKKAAMPFRPDECPYCQVIMTTLAGGVVSLADAKNALKVMVAADKII